ncbi:DUF2285 domain-containing protein [uncultured Algimonas sp.]|uniref:DNA -binding domain-containing protein n=1 Tax=uncultured Algimonas sp. TaxID=1547920 RepID=UPI002631A116|nr:DUF2285 domain-containing protein [uncultured Algimonas sp.]
MENRPEIIMSDAAWAWEGLRRNPGYRRAWDCHVGDLPTICDGRASLRYLRLDKPYLEAETFGLVAFADPDHCASEVPVIWLPNLLKRTLEVHLSVSGEPTAEGFSLDSLKCCPTVLDASDGQRHVRLGGHDFWIQMVSEDLVELDDNTQIEVRLKGRECFRERIVSVEQLFSLHRAGDGNPTPAKRPPNRAKLMEGLLAYDVGGASGRRGSLKDIAIAIFGEERIDREWSSNRSLKNHAVRARDRGRAFVRDGYRDYLRKAAF